MSDPYRLGRGIAVDKESGRDPNGFYIRTFTGRQLYWARVEDHDYDIRDIAHALAMKCRWSGHTSAFYSVAQHSVHVSEVVSGMEPDQQLSALLHDGSEAYMPDFPSPLKWYLDELGFTILRSIETRVDIGIANKFGVAFPRRPCVKEADLVMLGAEHRDLMPHGHETSHMPDGGFPPIECWSPAEAEAKFLARYSFLTGIVP